MYEVIFDEKNKKWKNCNIKTVWLEIDDYPKMVGSADFGVCMHYSSSGYDLPMKVVDMFSAQLPCLAFNYLSIGELVKVDENGGLFKDSHELYRGIIDMV